MDYETKSISRKGIRTIAKYARKAFGYQSEEEPFLPLYALESIPDILPGSSYEVVENSELPANVFARCMPKPEGGFKISIKEAVYDGAYANNNSAFLSFICHEICHIILFDLGYTPISNFAVNEEQEVPAFKSVEWQAKALCGEVQIPYEATVGMKPKDIMHKYNVTEASAKYRWKLDK